jgi:hypothetical protein
MTIEELQEKSNSLQAELHRINDELTKVNDEIYFMKQAESILWKPNAGQTYYAPFCGQYDGIYKTMPLVCDKDTLPPIDAFQMESQCDRVCHYLNLIVPIIKFGIENNDTGFTSMMSDDRRFLFEIYFGRKDLAEKASALYRRYE